MSDVFLRALGELNAEVPAYPPIFHNKPDPHRSHADYILALDRQQAIYNDDAVACQEDVDHGRLLPMMDGKRLICCKCGYTEAAMLQEDVMVLDA